MVHERKFNVKPTPRSSKLIVCLILTLIIALTTMTCSPVRLSQPVSAWVDQNNNLKKDQGEPPLEGVQFNAYDTINGDATLRDSAITDWEGKAILSFDKPASGPIKISIDAIPPEGYQPIEKGSKRIKNFGDSDKPPIEFGFSRVAGIESPTPKPPALDCTIYSIKSEDFAYDSKIGLWAANFDGAAKYSSENNTWQNFPQLPENSSLVQGIEIDPTGEVFLRTWDSIAKLVNDQWQPSEKNRSIEEWVHSFGESSDGTIWYAVPAPPKFLL
jgi:hypothetical protein